MSTPKRATVYFEPDVYEALRSRSLEVRRSVSELVNEAMRTALAAPGSELLVTDATRKTKSATFDRLAKALKRRRMVRRVPRP